MEKVAIFGASGHAAVVIDAAEKQGAYKIAGLITNEIHSGHSVLGHGILGRDDDIEDLLAAQRFTSAFLAIGDNAIRQRIAESLSTRLPTLSYATIIHPSAIVGSGVRLGAGSFVAAGAVVGPRTSVGRHCIIFRDPVTQFRQFHSLLASGARMAHASPCYEYLYEYTRFHTVFLLGRSPEILADRTGFRLVDFINDGAFKNCIFEKL